MRCPARESGAAILDDSNKLQSLGNHMAIAGFNLVRKQKEQRRLVALVRWVNEDGAPSKKIGVLLEQDVAQREHKRMARMNQTSEGNARAVYRTDGVLRKTNAFVALEDGSQITSIATGDEAVPFPQLCWDVS